MSYQATPSYLRYKATLTDVAADAMAKFAGPGIIGTSSGIPLTKEKPDWKYITVETVTDTLTGTQYVLTGKTTNSSLNGTVASTDSAAVKGDGSTAFASATISGTGKTIFTCQRNSSTGATMSNIGDLLGFLIDVSTVTDLDGSINVTVY